MSVPSSFGDVCALAPEVQERLLASGAPMERLWSAWAIGMATQGNAARIEAAAFAEPHAGLRRHFVVVLAGMSRRAALEALALHDPDERVRASALQYLARLAVAMPEIWPLLAARLGEEPSADARRTLLSFLPDAPVPALRDPVLGRLTDDAGEVRAEAMELVTRWSQHDESLRADLWRVLPPPPAAIAADVRARQVMLTELVGVGGLGTALRSLVAAGNVAAALQVLALSAEDEAPSWDDVKELAAVGGTEVRDAIVDAMIDRLEEVPAAHVLDHAVAYQVYSCAPQLYALIETLPGLQPTELAPSLRVALVPIIAELSDQIRYGTAMAADIEPDDDLDPAYFMDFDNVDVAGLVADLTCLRAELERLCLR